MTGGRAVRVAFARSLAAAVATGLVLGQWAPAAAEVRERVIVVAGPAMGAYRDLTAAVEAGVRIAMAAAESRGRDGFPVVRIVAVDDGCSSAGALQAAAQAVSLGAAVVIGHPCAGAAMAAAPHYAAKGIVFLAPATTHPRLTSPKAGPVLRLAGRDDNQGRVAGRYLHETFKGAPLALLSDKTVAGRALVDAARLALSQAGRTDVIVGHVTAGESDYARLVRRLADARVAAVYFTGGSTEAATIARQMREAGLDARLLVAEAAAEAGLWRGAGEAGDGILALLPPDPHAITEAREAVRRLEERGVARVLAALRAHAAFEIWAEAARGTPDGRPAMAAIRSGTYATVVGPVSFAASGDARIPSYAVYEHRGGRLDQLWVDAAN